MPPSHAGIAAGLRAGGQGRVSVSVPNGDVGRRRTENRCAHISVKPGRPPRVRRPGTTSDGALDAAFGAACPIPVQPIPDRPLPREAAARISSRSVTSPIGRTGGESTADILRQTPPCRCYRPKTKGDRGNRDMIRRLGSAPIPSRIILGREWPNRPIGVNLIIISIFCFQKLRHELCDGVPQNVGTGADGPENYPSFFRKSGSLMVY